MTDETTARDRAIEVVYPAIRQSSKFHAGYAVDLTGEVVDALLAHPEVLRALAGAPTADVAVLAAESAAIANSGSCRCTEDEACWDHEALEMRAEQLLAAAPEGVDAADEPCECCGGDRLTVCDACEQHSCWAGLFMCEESRTAGTKKLAAAPEGVDLEAQGEMSDQLDAAQAAIQRVRDLCKPTGAHLLNKALFARDVLRALDGDADEEER